MAVHNLFQRFAGTVIGRVLLSLLALFIASVVYTLVVGHREHAPAAAASCTVVNTQDRVEVKISGPDIHGCTKAVRTSVGYWGYLGLGFSWEYGAPSPTGTPVCTDTTAGETFYDPSNAGDAQADCRALQANGDHIAWNLG
jgi:hypothetical protein